MRCATYSNSKGPKQHPAGERQSILSNADSKPTQETYMVRHASATGCEPASNPQSDSELPLPPLSVLPS